MYLIQGRSFFTSLVFSEYFHFYFKIVCPTGASISPHLLRCRAFAVVHADLVTLSACETALGKVANGDDVVGFTRGFLYAGTSSIVSSLWKVDDQATSILMQQFYKSLKENDKRSALRTAQLKVKDTYNSHPYFWAAFQITGSVQ
ncbi:MAG: CHAT domain-containing protein [Deltaproteobacteria bacterium]|nr:CHAT domain-containing protein [Deltaproteobacteria bacterium]